MSKARPLCWILDDDDFLAEELPGRVPGVKFRSVGSLLDLTMVGGSPAVIIIDLSAVGPLIGGREQFYAPIATVCDRFPGAEIVIASGVPVNFAAEVVERVREYAPDSVIHIHQRGRHLLSKLVPILEAHS